MIVFFIFSSALEELIAPSWWGKTVVINFKNTEERSGPRSFRLSVHPLVWLIIRSLSEWTAKLDRHISLAHEYNVNTSSKWSAFSLLITKIIRSLLLLLPAVLYSHLVITVVVVFIGSLQGSFLQERQLIEQTTL